MVTCEPDIINWHNFNSSSFQTFKRKLVTLLSAGSIIGITILILFAFTNGYLNSPVKQSSFMDDDFTCSSYPNVSMHDVWLNSRESYAFKSQQMMTCFCRQQFTSNFTEFFNINFDQYGQLQKKLNVKDKNTETPTATNETATRRL